MEAEHPPEHSSGTQCPPENFNEFQCIVLFGLRSQSVAMRISAVEAEDPKTQERLMPRLADLVAKLLHVAPAAAWRGSVLSSGHV